MARTLKKCTSCTKLTLIKMSEAGHTRLYFCSECGAQKTQYLKKKVICRHSFEGGERCLKCGHQSQQKYA